MTKLPQVELDCEGGEEALIIKTSSRRAEGDWKVVVHNTLNPQPGMCGTKLSSKKSTKNYKNKINLFYYIRF